VDACNRGCDFSSDTVFCENLKKGIDLLAKKYQKQFTAFFRKWNC
jgi:hypothetical protein